MTRVRTDLFEPREARVWSGSGGIGERAPRAGIGERLHRFHPLVLSVKCLSNEDYPMPRLAKTPLISDIIEEAVHRVVDRVSAAIASAIHQAEQAQPRFAAAPKARRVNGRRPRVSSRPEEMTRWVADNRARRVPKFVIEATKLDTKKKIVARFGENSVFEKGKPLPGLLDVSHTKPAPADRKVARKAGRPRQAKSVATSASHESATLDVDPALRTVKARPPIIRKGAATRAS